jgi:ribosomal protein S2
MPIKQNNKNVNMSIDYLYKIIIQNNIKFGHSQYLKDKATNLYIFQTKEFEKERIEFFNRIDLKYLLYKVFLYIKTLYAFNSKQNNFLFATITPAYSEIITNAALSTNSIYHVDR